MVKAGNIFFTMWPTKQNNLMIRELLPEFYSANMDKVLRGVIIFYSEPLIFEGAVLYDTETEEMLFISYK